MNRSLLWQEFVRNVTAAFVYAVGMALVLALLDRAFRLVAPSPAEANDVVGSITLLVTLALSASAGVEAISPAFRKGPLALLDVVPVSRAQIWLLRVASSFIGSLSIVLVLLIVQPLLRNELMKPRAPSLIGAWLLLYALGTCISPISSSIPVVAIAAAGGASALTYLVFFIAERHLLVEPVYQVPTGVMAGVVMGGVLAPLCLLMSLMIFIRGEMDLPRRRLRNGLVLVGVFVVALLASVIGVDAGLHEIGMSWKSSTRIGVSPDTSLFSVVQFRGNTSSAFRIVSVEAATGNVAGIYEGRNFGGAEWNADNSLIVFTKDSVLRYFLSGGYENLNATRVFPRAESLFHIENVALSDTTADSRGALMLLQTGAQRNSYEYTLSRIESSGQPRELLKLPKAGLGTYSLIPSYDGSLVFSNNAMWRVREDAVALRAVSGMLRLPTKEDLLAAVTKLTNTAGPPGSPVGRYVQTSTAVDFNDSFWLYYMQLQTDSRKAALWARRNGQPTWKQIRRDLPLSDPQVGLIMNQRANTQFASSLLPELATHHSGIVAYLEGKRVHLYDVNTDEHFDLGTFGETPYGLDFRSYLDSYVILTITQFDDGKLLRLPVCFMYRTGSGAPLSFDGPQDRAFMALSGRHRTGLNAVQRDADKWDLFFIKAGSPPRPFVIESQR